MTHQITGVGLAAASVAALDARTATAAALVGGAWLGSLLPDADRAGSRVYRATPIERRIAILKAAGKLVRLPLRMLALLPHRGLTHSLFACALAAVLAGLLVSLVFPEGAIAAGAGVAIGYGAHVAADACTPSGVPLWAPASKRRRWLLPAWARIKTGSVREYVVATLSLTLLVAATVLLSG